MSDGPANALPCSPLADPMKFRNKLDKHNLRNMIDHIRLSCEKAFENVFTNRTHISLYLFVIIAVAIAIFLQSHYFTTNQSYQDYFTKLLDRINGGDITEIDDKTIMKMTSRQAGVNKELDNQLRQARLRINELENNISAVKAEIHKEFTKSKSDKEQLQKVIENLSVREMKLFEELMRSKSLINVLRTSFNALMVRHSGELTQPKPADCDCGILTSRIKHLLSSLESIYISYNSYKSLWPLILDLSNKIPEQVAPAAILKMSNFTKMNESKERWYSKPFFAYKGGYKMSLIVDAVGSEKGEGTHVSVYLFLMKGPHDDELQQSGNWPLRGTFTIELLNQLDDYRHRTSKVYISNTTSSSSVTNRIMNGSYAPSGRGISQFISHNDAFLNAYLKNDTLYFRINYQGSSQLSYHLHRNIGWQYIRLLLIAVIIICGTL